MTSPLSIEITLPDCYRGRGENNTAIINRRWNLTEAQTRVWWNYFVLAPSKKVMVSVLIVLSLAVKLLWLIATASGCKQLVDLARLQRLVVWIRCVTIRNHVSPSEHESKNVSVRIHPSWLSTCHRILSRACHPSQCWWHCFPSDLMQDKRTTAGDLNE